MSREVLQQSTDVKAIRVAAVKRVLNMLEDLAKNTPDTYATFWKEFGRVLKEGIGEGRGQPGPHQQIVAIRLDP